jgi:hypothetical protein
VAEGFGAVVSAVCGPEVAEFAAVEGLVAAGLAQAATPMAKTNAKIMEK